MAYQALLFCPEEKTARTVTQVLGELEFQVEPCTEPFAAVKKLMGQHFDAIVVDCDNEQNATLLFKSARNSTSNQASLAVAIVEGQAGVAKAFRIGANLVLTKPINVEQSKGTLRVARGLLRKGEPVKPAATATAISPTPAKPSAPPVSATPKPAAPKPVAPIKTEAPVVATSAAPRPTVAPVVKPAAAPPAPSRTVAAPAAKTVAAPKVETVSSKPVESPAAPVPAVPLVPAARPVVAASAAVTPSTVPTPVAHKPSVAPVAAPPPEPVAKASEARPATPSARPMFVAAPEGPVGMFGTGAASAPAPAREGEPAPKAEPVPAPERHAAEDLFEKPAPADRLAASATEVAPAISSEPASEPVPSFTFGGANTEEQPSGAGKKILLIAAFAVVVVGAYFGWNYFQNQPNHAVPTASAPSAVTTPVQPSTQPPAAPVEKPVASSPSNPQPEASSTPDITLSGTSDSTEKDSQPSIPSSTPSKPSTAAPAPDKGASAAKPVATPAAEPLVVKGGSVPSTHSAAQSSAATDAAPPSLVGIAAAGSDGALSNIVGSGTAARPVLQTMNISQGVSSGLITKRVQPVYPKTALAMHIEGAVELQATISKSGAITAVKVVKGDSQLSRAAVDAVKQWKYKPYLLNGEPVDIQTQVTVNFKLPR